MSNLIEEPGENKDWCTPKVALDPVYEFGEIGLDPCSNMKSIVYAKNHWTIDSKFFGSKTPDVRENMPNFEAKTASDTFAASWAGYGLVYVNPPYGDESEAFFSKMVYEYTQNLTEIIALVPTRSDTKRWHKYAAKAVAQCNRKGRIKFIDYQTGSEKAGAKFPSTYLYYGLRPMRFYDAFSKIGDVRFSAELVLKNI